MRQARMLIPTTAAIALSSGGLSGCGDDESAAADAFRVGCEKYQRCEPEEFAMDYASIDDCVEENVEYLEEYREEIIAEYGQACFDTYEAYFICYAEAAAALRSCGEYLDDTGYCVEEYAAIYTECDFVY